MDFEILCEGFDLGEGYLHDIVRVSLDMRHMTDTMTAQQQYIFKNQESVPSRIYEPLLRLYRSWDEPHSDGDYLNSFAPDGCLSFSPSPVAQGRDAIRALRDGMLHPDRGPLVGIKHILDTCWIPAGSSIESKTPRAVVTGNIWYRLKNGKEIEGEFASYAAFAENEKGALEFTSYIVYFDTLGLMTALKEQAEAESHTS